MIFSGEPIANGFEMIYRERPSHERSGRPVDTPSRQSAALRLATPKVLRGCTRARAPPRARPRSAAAAGAGSSNLDAVRSSRGGGPTELRPRVRSF
ncbi:hypothetical protein EVAR_67160_1 [Eumeta japonica]|uniref:Uncharacterized protein n=1 Tax=Eumeta variegata TaxID=151549 RepID=A0A4C1ZPM5_EUMVA|nr:hypothetical protein EVAR_67160_1 [Eumeta japonica]